jgi:hypothetical protein
VRVIGYLVLFSLLALALSTFEVATSCEPDERGMRQQHTSVCFLMFCLDR